MKFGRLSKIVFLCLIPSTIAQARRYLPEETRLYRSGAQRIVFRFVGTEAQELLKQLRKNYRKKVRGTVEGQDVACSHNEVPDAKSPGEDVCAFFVDRQGQLSTVFTVKPENDEQVAAAATLLSFEQLRQELGPKSFAAAHLSAVKSEGPAELTADQEKRYRLEGADAELLFHFLTEGKLRRKSSLEAFHDSHVSRLVIAKKNLECAAERHERGGEVQFRCRFAFDRRGAAKNLETRDPTLQITRNLKALPLHKEPTRVAKVKSKRPSARAPRSPWVRDVASQ